MEAKKKKKPSDYPIFSFRVSKQDKDELTMLINDIAALANKGNTEDEWFTWNKDIIVEALRIGLKTLKKRYQ